MNIHLEPITTAEEIRELAEHLMREEKIAVDTEFIRESSFFPDLQLIQIGTREDVWLIDFQAFRRRKAVKEELAPLMEVFGSPSVLKIVHAAQGDQECIYSAFGVVMKPSLDTAIAAALCGFGEGIGLANLLKAILGVRLKKGHARTDWSRRPLPEQLREYAASDVEHLVELTDQLFERLDKYGRRQWALELSSKYEEPSQYQENPEAIYRKLSKSGRVDEKSAPVLFELVKWRERRVRELNVPRRWLADDGTLMDIARVRPSDLEHLISFRGANKGELKKNGESILRLIAEAQSHPAELPKVKRPRPPSPRESRVADLFRCYLGILADDINIASKYLISSAEYMDLVRTHATDPQQLVQSGIMSQGACDLIGEKVLRFLHGKMALSLDRAEGVKIVDVDD